MNTNTKQTRKNTRTTELYCTRVVGVTFEDRQRHILVLQKRDTLFLVRDRENLYDRNAIQVVTKEGKQIGFLDRELAAILAPKLDKLGMPVTGFVENLTGGYAGMARGVWVEFRL